MILWCVEADEKTWRISWFWNILTYSYDILPWFYDVVHSYSKDRLSKGWRSMWRELRLSRVMSNIWHKYMVQKCFRFWGVGVRPAISIYTYLAHLENIAGRAPPLLKIWNILNIKQLAKTMNLALYVFIFFVSQNHFFFFNILCKTSFFPFYNTFLNCLRDDVDDKAS